MHVSIWCGLLCARVDACVVYAACPQERVIEVVKPIVEEKIVEVPQVHYVEKIVEVTQQVVQEKIVHVPKVEVQERIIEIPKIQIQVSRDGAREGRKEGFLHACVGRYAHACVAHGRTWTCRASRPVCAHCLACLPCLLPLALSALQYIHTLVSLRVCVYLYDPCVRFCRRR